MPDHRRRIFQLHRIVMKTREDCSRRILDYESCEGANLVLRVTNGLCPKCDRKTLAANGLAAVRFTRRQSRFDDGDAIAFSS